MKQKYYLRFKDDEICYNEEYFIELMKYRKLKEIQVFKAVPEKHYFIFWCKYYRLCGDRGQCGKKCDNYKPRNGKSGCCKYYTNILYNPGEKVILKINK